MPKRVITAEQARLIREENASKRFRQYEIAERYGISRRHVVNIVRGFAWPDAGGPIVDREDRIVRGNDHGKSLLNEDDVKDILRWWKTGEVSYRDIADAYGVRGSTIGDIIKGRTWKHVPRGDER